MNKYALGLTVFMALTACERTQKPDEFSLGLAGRHPLPSTDPRKGVVVFIGQSNTPCPARYDNGQFFAELGGRDIGIIECDQGGTYSRDWQKGGALYQDCMTKIKATGRKVVALAYVQGESEALDNSPWRTPFEQLVKDFRADVGGTVPVVWERLDSLAVGVGPYLSQIRDEQTNATPGSGAYVDLDGIPLSSDSVHFPSTQCPEVGRRYGATLAPLLQ